MSRPVELRRRDYPDLCKALQALASLERRVILERLAVRPQAVVELAEGFEITRPAISRHLKVLLEAGLLRRCSHGPYNVYEVLPQAMEDLRAYADALLRAAVASSGAGAERPAWVDAA